MEFFVLGTFFGMVCTLFGGLLFHGFGVRDDHGDNHEENPQRNHVE